MPEVVRGTVVPPVQEGEGEFLRAALEALPPEAWDETTSNVFTGAVKAATGRKGKALFLPLRLALTGEDHGPEMKVLLPLIGREWAGWLVMWVLLVLGMNRLRGEDRSTRIRGISF